MSMDLKYVRSPSCYPYFVCSADHMELKAEYDGQKEKPVLTPVMSRTYLGVHRILTVCGQLYRPVRGAKSVGTRETGSKKVNWPVGEKDKHEVQKVLEPGKQVPRK